MSHTRLRCLALGCALVLCASASWAQAAHAQAAATSGAAKPKAKPASQAKATTTKKVAAKKLDPKLQAQLKQARDLLASEERANVEAGIQSLGMLGVEAAVEPLVERIRLGLPSDLLETALVTLMALGQPSAGPVLFDLAQYRRPAIRVLAIEAIAAVRPSGGEAVLVSALGDAEQTVRSAAATGLGEIGTASSLDTLFVALDHGNLEAATAIGKLVPARDVRRLFGYLGRVPLRSLGLAFAETLKRKDVAENDKLAVVARLEEVGTAEAKAFFADLMTSTEGGLPPNVSKAVLRAMQEIAGK